MFSPVLVALCSSLVAFATPVGISARQSCADVTVVFARGTGEASPIGSVVGPPFQSALSRALSGQSLAFNGVQYSATIAGFLEGGDPAGSARMAQMVTSSASSCPSTKIVMSGYRCAMSASGASQTYGSLFSSQGAQLVHNSASQLSSSTASHVAAVVMFGDPDNGQALANGLSSRSLTFCNAGDNICQGGDIVLPAHLAYGANATQAASFVTGRV